MDSKTLVAEIVQQSDMSKSELSKASGVSRSLLDSYLKGESQPSLAQIQRIAEAAGCTVEHTVRKHPERSVSDQFLAVLEFGELFPSKAPKPLVNLGPIWQATRART